MSVSVTVASATRATLPRDPATRGAAPSPTNITTTLTSTRTQTDRIPVQRPQRVPLKQAPRDLGHASDKAKPSTDAIPSQTSDAPERSRALVPGGQAQRAPQNSESEPIGRARGRARRRLERPPARIGPPARAARSPRSIRPAAALGRGNTRSNIHSVNASNASSKSTNLDDLDARGNIYAPCTGLRALWTLWSVEVRVLSGALGKPRTAGLFAVSGRLSTRRPRSW